MGIMTKISPDDLDKALAALAAAFPALEPQDRALLGNGAKAELKKVGEHPRQNIIIYYSGKIVANNISAEAFTAVELDGVKLRVMNHW